MGVHDMIHRTHITGLISEQLLRAAVGGSVLIPCSLHDNRTLSSVYWQEGEQHFFLWDSGKIIQIPNNKYENRAQVFHDKFSSGNISFRLDNISLEDDRKTFFAYVKFDKESQSEERCRSTLQVSDPLNPTQPVSTPPPEKGENEGIHVAAIVLPFLFLLVLAGVYWYRGQHQPQAQDQDQPQAQDQDQPQAQDQDQPQGQDLDPPSQPLVVLNSQDRAQEEATAQAPDAPNQPPVQFNPQDGAQAQAEADAPEDTVPLSEDRAEFFCQTRMSEGTADRDTCEDAAASPEKDKLLKKENGNEDSASD
ncbi:uncharacterized protein LOC119026197 [Acanthopagrus latus]|uniref:uncharacterized protein LOC119026197 n=1 Tax=Acanthopagrus latus TaxID=8177 RepID=UPI00187D07DB|nr:uncharacterized protein LOC119026197 [Acanthopagrus latus]